jgi:cell division protein ZapB
MKRDQNAASLESMDLQALEAQVDELIRTCDQLSDENRALRDQQSSLVAERASLIEKSELARSRVEAMIARLKAMEIGA